MGAVTDVFLITGFLGSGKTTFLNRLTAGFSQDRKIMILMNEFGNIGIDGLLVEGEDLDILEISRGSIFCACVKTDFIRGLARIAREIQPDVLIIEATGAADPRDMKRDLGLSVFQHRFRLREQICLIDAENFMSVHEAFVSVEKQMVAATSFIINKIDRAEPSELRRIREIIRRHNSDAALHETTFGKVPLEGFTEPIHSLEASAVAPANPASGSVSRDGARETEPEAALAAEIERLLRDPLRIVLPPDSLSSDVYVVRETTTAAFHALVKALPPGILRAKGFVRLEGNVHLFSWVMGKIELQRVAYREIPETILGRLVFIGRPDAVQGLSAIYETCPIIRHKS